MRELPSAVLFACSQNAILSPLAEAILKHLHGARIYVQSVGVRSAEIDPFAVAVMEEIGIDLKRAARLIGPIDELQGVARGRHLPLGQ